MVARAGPNSIGPNFWEANDDANDDAIYDA